MLKKIVFLVMLAVLVAVIPSASAVADGGAQPVYVYVDGMKVAFPDQKPYVDENSRTMVPVRFVSQALGAKVGWTAKTQEVSVTDTAAGRYIKLWIGKENYTINGASKAMDTRAVLTAAGRTMVPLRFVSEGLGCEVEYRNVEGYGVVFNFTRAFKGDKAALMAKVESQVRREALGQYRVISQSEMKKGTEIQGVVTKADPENYWDENLAPYIQLTEVSCDDLPVSIPVNDMPLIIYDLKIDEKYGNYDKFLKDNPGAIFVKANQRFDAVLVCADGRIRGRDPIPFNENGKADPEYKSGTVTEFRIALNNGEERSSEYFGTGECPKATKESLKWIIIYDDSYKVSNFDYSGIYIKNPYYKGE